MQEAGLYRVGSAPVVRPRRGRSRHYFILVKLPVAAGTGVALVVVAQRILASCQFMASCTRAHILVLSVQLHALMQDIDHRLQVYPDGGDSSENTSCSRAGLAGG